MVSALVLKAQATRIRSKDTDVADIWRCLEIAFAAGVGPEDFAGGVRAESAELIRSLSTAAAMPLSQPSPSDSSSRPKPRTAALPESER